MARLLVNHLMGGRSLDHRTLGARAAKADALMSTAVTR